MMSLLDQLRLIKLRKTETKYEDATPLKRLSVKINRMCGKVSQVKKFERLYLLKQLRQKWISPLCLRPKKVLTPDGKEIIETRDNKGIFRSSKVTLRPWGFVADVKPDLDAAQVLPGLFLSSQDVAQELNILKQLDISHILNLATNVDNCFEDEFVYKKIEILDLPTSDIRKYFQECFAFIDDALKNDKKVLVHCNAGVSRSATIVVAYLMLVDRLSLTDAMDKVRALRSCIRPNEGFMKQLHDYEKDLQKDQTTKCQL